MQNKRKTTVYTFQTPNIQKTHNGMMTFLKYYIKKMSGVILKRFSFMFYDNRKIFYYMSHKYI